MNSEYPHMISALLRERRSTRDFRPDAVPQGLLDEVLADANRSPSWSNTQPYRVAVASGALCDRLRREFCRAFDGDLPPDGDFDARLPMPEDLKPRRKATGTGLFKVLGIARDDMVARKAQMRRNFEFFGAPTVLFFFVHKALGVYSVLDAGIALQGLMLSAQARGLATCAQGALAPWASPVRRAFAVPDDYLFLCGVAVGYASDAPVNDYDPGRRELAEMLISARPT